MDYDVAKLRVIIPVGGLAKRLLPLTAEVSKAVISLLNRPMIEISLLCLANQGIKNFIFGVKGYTNYRSLHDYFESGIGFSARNNISPRVHIKYQPNIDDCGSADSARINMEYYDVDDPVFAVQGDNIFDAQIRDMLKFHEEKDALMTIGLRKVKDVTGYGIAEISRRMQISRFIEKPAPEKAPSNLANTGLYMFTPEVRKIFEEKEVKQMIKRQKRLDFGYDFIPYLLRTGRPVYGYELKGSWYDVGSPERYLEAMVDILHGKLASMRDFGGRIEQNTSIWVQGESAESAKRRKVIIDKIRKGRIQLEGAVLIGRHCEIGDNVRITDSCIGNYTRIGKGVSIERSAIMDRVVVGEKAGIKDSIIGRHVTLNSTEKTPTIVKAVSVIADDVTVMKGSSLSASKVYPHLLVKGKYVGKTVAP